MNSAADTAKPNDPRREDARADRRTFFWVALFMAGSFLVEILSTATEIGRAQLDAPLAKIIIYEATGYGVFLALFPLIARAASIATPGQHDWRKVIAFHLAASIAVSLIHVAVMVTIRKIVFWIAFPDPYIFTDNILRDFVYEYRKDLFGYALFVFLIIFGRQLDQQRRELAAAGEDARQTRRLTLKCGGRSIFVDAEKVIWVKSASNYVELNAGAETHLARTTLSAIEDQLTGAGVRAVRVHRSWVINAGQIGKIEPTGEGDVKIELKDGTVVPGSRRYRDRLPTAP